MKGRTGHDKYPQIIQWDNPCNGRDALSKSGFGVWVRVGSANEDETNNG